MEAFGKGLAMALLDWRRHVLVGPVASIKSGIRRP